MQIAPLVISVFICYLYILGLIQYYRQIHRTGYYPYVSNGQSKAWIIHVICKGTWFSVHALAHVYKKSWIWVIQEKLFNETGHYLLFTSFPRAPYWLYNVQLISGLEHYYSLGVQYDGLVLWRQASVIIINRFKDTNHVGNFYYYLSVFYIVLFNNIVNL